ncbi:hypothetical protein ACFL1H_02025 [Nanoarchaeota archaeon]
MDDGNLIELGGNIQLSGFTNLKPGEMTIIKKLVGTQTKKISTICTNFETINLNMRANPDDAKTLFELKAKLIDNGKVITSEVTDKNLFFALDSVMKKIINQIS